MGDVPPAKVIECSPDEYHKLPGFSSSLAKVLIAKSPMHAKDAADRHLENIDEEDGMTDQQLALRERGSVLHALLLGKGKRIAVQKVDAYRTKEAKADRDKARSDGHIPVKSAKMEVYELTAIAIRSRLTALGHRLDGATEMAIQWCEPTPHGYVLCKGMLDHVTMWGHEAAPLGMEPSLSPPGAIIDDLKIVGDASPPRNERSAESLGYAIQRSAYVRSLTALYPRLGGRITFRFLFCEPHRPFAVWCPTPSGMFRELGEQRWLRAVHAWGEGMATGRWPGYATHEEIDAPMWALKAEGFTSDE